MSEPSTNGALEAFLPRLRSSIPSTSLSYLPTTLPLAFPSPLHLINTLTTIHIVHALLSHPSHISYFATTSTTPDDTAVRGVLGLYISSSEGWAKDNLLGATAWRTVMSEEKMTEYFGIETTREKEHDTMKGIKVGGRWDEGAKVVEGLVGLFRDLGEKLGGAKCLGEVVQDVLGRAKQQDDTGGYATVCCNEATTLVPSLADPYPSSTCSHLPASPIRLLQDLAYRQGQYHDLDTSLPDHSELANITPLPLPLGVLLQAGILSVPEQMLGLHQALNRLTPSARGPAPGGPSSEPRTTGQSPSSIDVRVEAEAYDLLVAQSVQACEALHLACAGENTISGRPISVLDIVQACEAMERDLVSKGRHLRLIPM